MEVLIVAADVAVRQELESFFRRRRHTLTVCRDCGEGRAALAGGAYSIALIDLEPDLEPALETFREIRRRPDLRDAYVLAVSRLESTRTMRAALEAGADDYLPKPIAPTALKLRLAIGQRQRAARQRSDRSAEDGTRRFRTLLETMREGVFQVDAEGRIELANSRLARITGFTIDELIGQRADDILVAPEVRDRLPGQSLLGLSTGSETYTIPLSTQTGEPIWVTLTTAPSNDGGGSLAVVQDITERRRAEAHFQQLFHNSPSGIVIIDDTDRIVDVNRGFVDLFHFEAAEVKGQRLSDSIVPDHLVDEASQLSRMVYERHTVHHETVRRRKDGSTVDVAVLGYPVELTEGRIGAFGLYTDITERKRAERKLFHDAFHDPLTGLPNRTLLVERLERQLRRAKRRNGYRFAVLFLDLDRFKEVNDNLGHAAGDQLLIDTAARLEGCLRPGDTTARLSGDEFIVLLEDVKEVADATRVADRILETLCRPVELAGQTVEVSTSLGLVIGTADYERAEDLIRDADVAMYRAKEHGKARYEIFDAKMHKSAVGRRRLEKQLARAIEKERQVLHYQPVFSLATGKLAGFEALVRWRHPKKGFLGPAELIPICEDTGLIHPLGRWVLEHACGQLAAWLKQFPEHDGLRVSINTSIQQILAPELVQEAGDVAAAAGVKPASIALEVPESLLADHPESAPVLWQLRRLGFRIQIDDFGTGHTSLRELYRSPVSVLKVDRSFIARMKPGGEDVEVVRAAAALGTSLGLAVVAEGVETARQLEQVRELGLTHAQGFLLSKPKPADEITELIAEDPRW